MRKYIVQWRTFPHSNSNFKLCNRTADDIETAREYIDNSCINIKNRKGKHPTPDIYDDCQVGKKYKTKPKCKDHNNRESIRKQTGEEASISEDMTGEEVNISEGMTSAGVDASDVNLYQFNGDFVNSKGDFCAPYWVKTKLQLGDLFFGGSQGTLYVKTACGIVDCQVGEFLGITHDCNLIVVTGLQVKVEYGDRISVENKT